MSRFVLALFALLALVPVAYAEQASARLVYRAEGDDTCPDVQAFRDIVVARLGYDPFRDAAPLLVDASILPESGALLGELRLYREDNTAAGSRELGGPLGQCWELANALAVALAVALDPLAAPPPSEPTPAPVPESSSPEPSPVAASILEAKAAPKRRLGVALMAGAGVGFGVTPGPSLAPAIGVGLRIDQVSMLVEGRLDLMSGPRATDTDDRVEAAAFAAGPTACLAFGVGLSCLGLEFGAFQGRGVDVEDARTQSSFFAAASARLGAFLPLNDALSLGVLGELRAPLVRTSLRIEGRTVWNAPPLAGGLRLALRASFP